MNRDLVKEVELKMEGRTYLHVGEIPKCTHDWNRLPHEPDEGTLFYIVHKIYPKSFICRCAKHLTEEVLNLGWKIF